MTMSEQKEDRASTPKSEFEQLVDEKQLSLVSEFLASNREQFWP